MERIVGIGEFIISNNSEDCISTYALASCVAVTAYSYAKGVAGMIHIALPLPPKAPDLTTRPSYYAVTGLPAMINAMYKDYGCKMEELIIGLYGGADSIHNDVFKIGQKNVAMVKKILLEMRLSYITDETSGYISRTLYLDVAHGTVNVKTQPIKI